jgi:hypothetical protein
MFSDSPRFKGLFGGLFLVSVVASFAAAGCSDIRPEPNVEEGGLVESETHEQDTLREDEQHQERNR